jgi:hypothetical protein
LGKPSTFLNKNVASDTYYAKPIGTAEQLAEKFLFSDELHEKHTAGAKAQYLFYCGYGSQG